MEWYYWVGAGALGWFISAAMSHLRCWYYGIAPYDGSDEE